jgi:adenylate cyclase
VHIPAALTKALPLARISQVIAVVDVVESVRLMEQDEQEFIRGWQRFVAFVLQRLPADSGRLHKSLGDGLMLQFSDSHGCIRSALGMRAWFVEHNRALAPEDQIQLRIGAHLAEFVSDEYDIYGTDVNLAARITSLAGPGEIVLSSALRDRLAPELQEQLEDLGSCHLRHVKAPVHAFRVGTAGRAPVMPARRPALHRLRPTLAVLTPAVAPTATATPASHAWADDVVAALAPSDHVQVASHVASNEDGGLQGGLAEVRRLLRPDYVLTGRPRAGSGNRRVFLELVDSASGHVAWARTIPAVPGGALADIGTALQTVLIASEVERSRGEALPALGGFTLQLASIGLMHRASQAEVARAQAMLEHLLERGRGHAEPHAWLAHLHLLRVRQHGGDAAGAESRSARAHAADAVQCDSTSALALAMEAQACVYASRDADAAAELYAQALAACPDHSLGLLLRAELLALNGRGKAALEDAQRACRTLPAEPLRGLYDAVCALASLVAGDAPAAVTLARRAVDRGPHFLPALRTLAAAQALSGDVVAAQRTVGKLAQRQAGFTLEAIMAALPACHSVADLFTTGLQKAGVPEG